MRGSRTISRCCPDQNINERGFFAINNSAIRNGQDTGYRIDYKWRISDDLVTDCVSRIWVFCKCSHINASSANGVFLDKVGIRVDVGYRTDRKLGIVIANLNGESSDHRRSI